MQRRWSSLVLLVVVASAAAGCRGDDGPDPAAVKSATAAGELVGSSLGKVIAELRRAKTADPPLTVPQALDRPEAGRGALVPARDAIDQLLAEKGIDLSEMMFRFSEGVASRLPPVTGVVVEPASRPKFDREYKGDDRRFVTKFYANWAVIRAMLVDAGPPKPFRDLFAGEEGPPSGVLDPAGNIVIPFVEGRRYDDLFSWISDDPVAGTTLVQLRRALGF